MQLDVVVARRPWCCRGGALGAGGGLPRRAAGAGRPVPGPAVPAARVVLAAAGLSSRSGPRTPPGSGAPRGCPARTPGRRGSTGSWRPAAGAGAAAYAGEEVLLLEDSGPRGPATPSPPPRTTWRGSCVRSHRCMRGRRRGAGRPAGQAVRAGADRPGRGAGRLRGDAARAAALLAGGLPGGRGSTLRPVDFSERLPFRAQQSGGRRAGARARRPARRPGALPGGRGAGDRGLAAGPAGPPRPGHRAAGHAEPAAGGAAGARGRPAGGYPDVPPGDPETCRPSTASGSPGRPSST